MLRSCGGCGRSVSVTVLRAGGGRCPLCLAGDPRRLARVLTGSWSPDRNLAAHVRMRRAVRRRAGGRCEQVENGQRCTSSVGLQMHHLRPGYEPEDGVLLCRDHHRAVDPYAR